MPEGDDSDFLADFVRALVLEGLTVVVAAGNDNDVRAHYECYEIIDVSISNLYLGRV